MMGNNPPAIVNKCRFPDSFEIYDFNTCLGKSTTTSPSISSLDYTFIWIEQGKGELHIDGQAFSIASNALFCIKPGQPFYCMPGVQATGYVVAFGKAFLDLYVVKSSDIIRDSLFNNFLRVPVVYLKENTKWLMEKVAAKMMDEFSGHAAYKKTILKGFLKAFIIYAGRAADNTDHQSMVPKKAALVQQFYELIEKYFVSKKMVRDYAAMLHVSAGHLNDVVREISGASASYHIQQRIIREAKSKLFFNNSSLKEIAFSLGFNDQAHFSKYFKNICGTCFTDFKKGITSGKEYLQGQ